MQMIRSIFKALTPSSVRSVSAAEAKQLIDGNDAPSLIDVRQPDEYKSGHIAGAALMPLGDLSKRMHELPKEREILCVCRSGARSGAAARQLAAAGFTVVNLRGGVSAWENAGFKLKKGK